MNKNDIGIFARCLSFVGKILFLSLFSSYLAGGVAIAASGQECVPGGTALANPQGILLEVTGDVTARVGKGATCPVVKGQTVVSDTIFTTGPKSSAVIRFADGQGVSLGENASFHVQQYVFDQKNAAKNNIVFALLKGGARFVTGVIGQKNKAAFKLTAGTTTIGIRGTVFAFTVLPDGSMVAAVQSGQIAVGGQLIGANQAFTVSLNAAGQLQFTPSNLTFDQVANAAGAPNVASSGAVSIPAGAPTAGTVASAAGAAAGAAAAAGGAGGFGPGAVAIAAAIAAAVVVAASQNNNDQVTAGTTTGTGTGTGTGTQ